MKKILIQFAMIALVVLTLGVFTNAPHSQARSPKLGYGTQLERPHDPNSVLVKFTPDSHSSLKQRPGVRHLFDNWYQIPVQSGQTAAQALQQWAERADVLTVELNYLVSLDEMETTGVAAAMPAATRPYPNDQYYSLQWHLPQVQADAAWNINRGANVTVAVVDSGVSRGSDLACRALTSPYNAITDTTGEAAVADDNSHGTHVIGTIGQCTNNSTGVAGMAPEVTIMPIKVLNASGAGTMAQIAAGINWAVDHHADVINMSLGMDCNGQGWPECSESSINDAIAKAANNDIVIIVATGNKNQSTVGFPSNHPQTIAVGAVDYNQHVAPYSNHGSAMTLTAPGGNVDQDVNNDDYPDGVLQQTIQDGAWDYYFYQGTSMAAPHVAGAAALLRSYVPTATRGQVKEALVRTAKDLGAAGFDNLYGQGLLQTADALNYLKTQQSNNPKIFLPLTLRNYPPPPPKGIYGRVTYNDQPAVGIKLSLRKYKGNDEVTVANAYVDSQGRYLFENVPALTNGYHYYVRYGPNSSDDHFVAVWFGPDIASYQAGETLHGGDFDIANSWLVSPDNRTTQALPVTFTWQKRTHKTDTYELEIFDPDNYQSWHSENIGYNNSYTLQTLPNGVTTGKAYGWSPILFEGSSGNSYGYTYYYRLITFQANGAVVSGDLAPLAQVRNLENKAR